MDLFNRDQIVYFHFGDIFTERNNLAGSFMSQDHRQPKLDAIGCITILSCLLDPQVAAADPACPNLEENFFFP